MTKKEKTIFPVIFTEQTTEDWYAEHFPELKVIRTENKFIIMRKKTSQKEISSILDSISLKTNE